MSNSTLKPLLFLCLLTIGLGGCQGQLPILSDGSAIPNNQGALVMVSNSYGFKVSYTLSTLVDGAKKSFESAQFPPGAVLKLAALPVGRYQLQSFSVDGDEFDLTDKNHLFEVKNGVINYPGSFVLNRVNGQAEFDLRVDEKLALSILSREYPEFSKKYSFEITQIKN